MNTFQLLALETALKAMRDVKTPLNSIGTQFDDPIFQGTQHWVGRLEELEREMQAVFDYHLKQ